MKNLIKRYFLGVAVGPSPFLLGFIIGALLACAAGVITTAVQQAILSLWLMGGCLVFGVALGILNEVVVHLFVSYRREPGLFMTVSYDLASGSYKLDDAGNPMWGKGFWVSVPRTDRPHDIELACGGVPVWGVPVALKVFFKGAFDPEEVRAIAVGGYRSFDDWLRENFIATVGGYPGVWQALRGINEHPLTELSKLLEKMDFSGQPMSNVDHILVEVSPIVAVSF